MVSTSIYQGAGSIAIRHRSRAAYFHVSGSLASAGLSPLEIANAALEHRRRLAILDLRDAQVLAAQDLEWLEQLTALCSAKGLRLRIVSTAGSRPNRMLELLRFDRFVVVSSTVRDALRFGRIIRRKS
ncbi:MAG: hypothetical protein JNM85_03595 [Chthonomonas sp.]|nr:hypothetical protein [Chthonomonas sp.]